MKKNLILVISAICFTACAGGNSNSTSTFNNSNNKPTTNVNSTENTNSEKKTNLTSANDDSEKIKPDLNAKIENGKEFSEAYFSFTLPKGWKKGKRGSIEEYTPEKEATDGLVSLSFQSTEEASFYPEKKAAASSPASYNQWMLDSVKSNKEKGRFDAYGTFGVGANGTIPPILGVTSMTNRAFFENDQGKECSAKEVAGCGNYNWDGLDSKNRRSWNFTVNFKEGTYEKNKPLIDAILLSIKFK